MNRGHTVFRIILGGFLGYTGFGLLKDALTKRPEHYVIFSAIGAAFIVFGIWYIIYSVKIQRKEQAEEERNQELTEEESSGELPENENTDTDIEIDADKIDRKEDGKEE